MKLVQTIRKLLELSHYALAKKIDLTQPGAIHLERNGKAIQIVTLAKLRKLSGLTWEQVGALIDRDAATISKS